jgi:hypothetical protein
VSYHQGNFKYQALYKEIMASRVANKDSHRFGATLDAVGVSAVTLSGAVAGLVMISTLSSAPSEVAIDRSFAPAAKVCNLPKTSSALQSILRQADKDALTTALKGASRYRDQIYPYYVSVSGNVAKIDDLGGGQNFKISNPGGYSVHITANNSGVVLPTFGYKTNHYGFIDSGLIRCTFSESTMHLSTLSKAGLVSGSVVAAIWVAGSIYLAYDATKYAIRKKSRLTK